MLLEANSVDSGDFRNYIWNDLAFIDNIAHSVICCGRPWPAAYINIIQNTHQIQVLTEALFRAQAIFHSLPNNEWGTKYRGLTYSAK